MPRRCHWARGEPEIAYHDREWGVPLHADRRPVRAPHPRRGAGGAQLVHRAPAAERVPPGVRRIRSDAGRALHACRVERILRDPGIIRHRGKIESAVGNARAFLAVQREHGSFAAYLWSSVGGSPIQNRRLAPRQVPAETALSRELSRDLRRRGFTFVGPTICYAFMQAAGLVNDHLISCFRHAEVRRLGRKPGRGRGENRRSSLRLGRRPT